MKAYAHPSGVEAWLRGFRWYCTLHPWWDIAHQTREYVWLTDGVHTVRVRVRSIEKQPFATWQYVKKRLH